MLVTIATLLLFVACFFVSRWVLRRIREYPATLFGPVQTRERHSS